MKPLRILLHAAVVAVLAGLLGTAMAWAQAEGPSLGELARKKKKDDKKSSHVYSDENLPKASPDFGGTSTAGPGGAPASASGSSEAPAAEGAATSAAAAGEAKAGEAAPDLAAAQEKVETAKQDEQSLKNNIKRLEDQLANETKESRRETYQAALESARSNLAEFTRRREEAEKEAAAAEAAGKKKKKPAATEEAPQ
jgi:hypothetical protein